MKRILLSIAAATLLWSCGNNTNIYWRNTKWNIKLDSNFVFKRKLDTNNVIYSKIGEKLCIGTETLDSVEYVFYKGNLRSVYLFGTLPTRYSIAVPKDSSVENNVIKTSYNNHEIVYSYHEHNVRKIRTGTELSFFYDSAGTSNLHEDKVVQYFNMEYGSYGENVWHDKDAKKFYFTLKIEISDVDRYDNDTVSHSYMRAVYNNGYVDEMCKNDIEAQQEKEKEIALKIVEEEKKKQENKLKNELNACPLK